MTAGEGPRGCDHPDTHPGKDGPLALEATRSVTLEMGCVVVSRCFMIELVQVCFVESVDCPGEDRWGAKWDE